MTTPHRPRVFLDVNIGAEPAGRLTIELFADKAPRTCENFRQLCTSEPSSNYGLSYARAPFHRVIDEFMVQGGDIERGDGTGTKSIYGGEFEDEDLLWREMDVAGLVCSANRGRDTNGCQFFITLDACPHLNGKHTIFGRLVAGQDTLQKIAKVEVDGNDRPLAPVLIARCGELERRKAKSKARTEEQQTTQATASSSDDRGRRRKSSHSDEEMADGVCDERGGNNTNRRRSRRQSDNVKDEGLRGRPRQRSGSGSRSPSHAVTSSSGSGSGGGEEEAAGASTPPEKHKRKRSPSPSRAAEPHGNDERRRRSLPNQYANGRRGHLDGLRGDEKRYRPSPRREGEEDYYNEGGRRDSGRHRWDENESRSRTYEDRYRPRRDHYRHDGGRLNGDEEGRLGGPSGDGDYGGRGSGENDPPVRFKGRGNMKYRESDRAW